jgi:hypothetical protein
MPLPHNPNIGIKSADWTLRCSKTVKALDPYEHMTLMECLLQHDMNGGKWFRLTRSMVSPNMHKREWSGTAEKGRKEQKGVLARLEEYGLIKTQPGKKCLLVTLVLQETSEIVTGSQWEPIDDPIGSQWEPIQHNMGSHWEPIEGDEAHIGSHWEPITEHREPITDPTAPEGNPPSPIGSRSDSDRFPVGTHTPDDRFPVGTPLKELNLRTRKDPDPDPPYSPPMTRNGKPIPTPPPSTPYQTFDHQHITELEADYPLPFQQNPEHTKIVNDWLMDNDQNQGVKNLALMAVNPPDHLKGIWNHKRVQDKINDIIAIEPQRAFIYALKTANELLDLVDEQTTVPARRPNFAQDDEMTLWRSQGATEGEKSPYRANTGLRAIREQANL